MSDFVNPQNCAVVKSANDMPLPWIVCTRAQSDAWEAIQYRKWVIDHIESMTPAEITAFEAAQLILRRDASAAELDQAEDIIRAFMLVVLDEFNAHALKMKAIMDAVDSSTSYASLKANVVAVADYPQRTVAQLRAAIRNKLGS